MAATERNLSVLLLIVVGMSASASQELTKQNTFSQDLMAEVSAPLLHGGLMYIYVYISVTNEASIRLFLF